METVKTFQNVRFWYFKIVFALIVSLSLILNFFTIICNIKNPLITNVLSKVSNSKTHFPTTTTLADSVKRQSLHPLWDSAYSQLIDLKNFRFLINKYDACDTCKHSFLLVIFVTTANENIDKRTAIRKTWGHQSACIKVLFFFGASNDERHDHVLQQEDAKHNDIIQGNFLDTYRNLTYKHVMMLKWAKYHCKQARYVVKTDDDVMVNIGVLYNKLIQGFWRPTKLIACNVHHNAPVLRSNSKWAVAIEEFSGSTYPDYCDGPFVIYSADVVHRLLEESTKARYFWIEDVHVTGTLAKRIGVKHVNISSLYRKSVKVFLSRPLQSKRKMISYVYGPKNLRPTELYAIWKAMGKT